MSRILADYYRHSPADGDAIIPFSKGVIHSNTFRDAAECQRALPGATDVVCCRAGKNAPKPSA